MRCVTSSHPPAVSLPGGVLPPPGRKDLQNPEGAGREEEETAPKSGNDAWQTWHFPIRPPTGPALYGADTHAPWAAP